MRYFLILVVFLSTRILFGQSDTSSNSYYDNYILYFDCGNNSSPFDIKVQNSKGSYDLKFRNNIKPFIGFGGNYKWISLRIGFLLNQYFKGVDDYVKTKIFKLGTDFTYKRFYFDFDLFQFKGFTLLKDNQIGINYNLKYANLHTNSFYLNEYFFFNKNFSYNSLRGKKQSVKSFQSSFYLKQQNAFTRVKDDNPILPSFFFDDLYSKTTFSSASSIEIGLIPGYGVADRYKNFQLGGMLGYGCVIIDKSIFFNSRSRNFLGLSSRFDFHLYAGYNKSKYFIMNYLYLENRVLDFNTIKFTQQILSYRFIVGYRF